MAGMERAEGWKASTVSMKAFGPAANEYLEIEDKDLETRDSIKYCNVLCSWLNGSLAMCAHKRPHARRG